MNEDELVFYCKENNIILNILIELTNACNLSCRHCYVPKHGNNLSMHMISSIVQKLKNEGTLYVCLSGGEPLAHPNFIEIYKLFKINGFIVTIKTNALLLTNDHVDLFKKYPPAQLNISVYGLNDKEYFEYCGDKYGFSRLESALELLCENNVRFSLVTIADKFHYQRIVNSDYTKFFQKYNCPLSCNYDLYNTNNGDDTPINLRLSNEQVIDVERVQFIDNDITFTNDNPKGQTKTLSCRGGICNAAIDVDANINGCLMDHKKTKLDFENWRFVKIWLMERNQDIENMFQASKCHNCEDAFLCQKCPLWHIRTVNRNSNDRCELAKMKKSLIHSL